MTLRTEPTQRSQYSDQATDWTVGSILGTVKAISFPKTTTLSLSRQELSRDKAEAEYSIPSNAEVKN
jgi:hypothetical protein